MQTPRRALVVSIHDVSPRTRDIVTVMLRDLGAAGIDRVSLLVIPNHHHVAPIDRDSSFCDWLRAASRDAEVVLHGYFHQRPATPGGWRQRFVTEHYTAGEGEFYDLTQGEAARRLAMGTQALAAIGLSPRGFIAPAWLLGAEAEVAVRKAGFAYTTRLRTFKDLTTGRETSSQSLVWSVRSGWRRMASLRWNALLANSLRKRGLMRIGLHPPDWNHQAVRRQVARLTRDALATREAITYEDWLARSRSER